MAVTKVINSSSLVMEIENGKDSTGNTVYKKKTFSGLKPDAASPILAPEDAIALMDTIIEKNIFETKNGTLTGKYNAYLTQKQVTKFDVA